MSKARSEILNTIVNKKGEQEEKSAIRHQLIVFKLGSEEYALQIDQVKEVVLTPEITKMPRTPDYIMGVANIRGNIIAIVDLEKRFNILDSEEGQKGMYTLVIESEDFKIGILVKEVPNTLAAYDDEIDDSPNIIVDSEMDESYIQGIVKSDNRLIILIDIFKVITEKVINSI